MAQSEQSPLASPATQSDSVLLEADELINDEQARTITAQGDVQVRYQGRTMRADRLVYNLDTGEIRAVGDVQIVLEDGSTTYAEEVQADEAMNVGAARELRARLGNTGTLAARAALRHGEGESELTVPPGETREIWVRGNHPSSGEARAPEEAAALISVADTGIGLKEEDLERIFHPFEQAHNPRSGMYQGTGLGLSLPRKLAKLHRGILWAESPGLGKGSTFQFLIPLFHEG